MPLPSAEIPPDQAFLAHCVDYASPHIEGLRAAMQYLRTEGIPDDPDEAATFIDSSELAVSVAAHTEALKALSPQISEFGRVLVRLGQEFSQAMDEALQAREERVSRGGQ
jgi:hypothetical protein